jgi:hypothetical protein
MPRWLARPVLGAALALFFAWRHRATGRWLAAHSKVVAMQHNVNRCFDTGGSS